MVKTLMYITWSAKNKEHKIVKKSPNWIPPLGDVRKYSPTMEISKAITFMGEGSFLSISGDRTATKPTYSAVIKALLEAVV